MSLYYDSLNYFPANNTFAPGSAPPGPPPSIGSWTYAGCYNDSAAARTLSSTNVGLQGRTRLIIAPHLAKVTNTLALSTVRNAIVETHLRSQLLCFLTLSVQ
jgi:hypothetical protein